MALYKACRCLALMAYQSNSLSIERVAGTTVVFVCLKVERAAVILGDFVDVIGLSPRLEERHNTFELLVRDKRAMDTRDAAAGVSILADASPNCFVTPVAISAHRPSDEVDHGAGGRSDDGGEDRVAR